MTLELISFIRVCICLRTSSIIHLVVMCLCILKCSQTLTHFSFDTFFPYCLRTNREKFFFWRWFKSNHNAMASSSVVVVLTFLSFRRETEGEKEISALFLAGIPLLCFRYLHSKCGAHRGQHEQRSLRIVGLNYSLEKKTKRKDEDEGGEGEVLPLLSFYIDELNYCYVIHNIDAWELIHSVCKSEKEREIQSYFVWWYIPLQIRALHLASIIICIM